MKTYNEIVKDGFIILLSMIVCLTIGVTCCYRFKISNEVIQSLIGGASALLGQIIGIAIIIFTHRIY